MIAAAIRSMAPRRFFRLTPASIRVFSAESEVNRSSHKTTGSPVASFSRSAKSRATFRLPPGRAVQIQRIPDHEPLHPVRLGHLCQVCEVAVPTGPFQGGVTLSDQTGLVTERDPYPDLSHVQTHAPHRTLPFPC